jgi:hypothetical protein
MPKTKGKSGAVATTSTHRARREFVLIQFFFTLNTSCSIRTFPGGCRHAAQYRQPHGSGKAGLLEVLLV